MRGPLVVHTPSKPSTPRPASTRTAARCLHHTQEAFDGEGGFAASACFRGATRFTITPTGEAAETFGLVRDGDVMTLTGDDTFDFNDDQTETPATLVITLTRP